MGKYYVDCVFYDKLPRINTTVCFLINQRLQQMKFFSPKKDYPFLERNAELNRISKIPYESIKLKALRRFEADEITLLRSRPNTLVRSHALESAQIKIASIERKIDREENGVTPAFANLCRALF